eukprot:CAMPEP_0115740604 /NCGR_PEP_ID=MMETSP0272-20121206/89566_1 /TAXON_ID=71861 /ORGANISM="Scrippsiella trochoidea, Strain CCMP3099" /LENGTH=90 /DNA_ID=CAMNT_0003185237 /DNA_START=44 /DNA_END=316 /DNA_ORIENTATION=+
MSQCSRVPRGPVVPVCHFCKFFGVLNVSERVVLCRAWLCLAKSGKVSKPLDKASPPVLASNGIVPGNGATQQRSELVFKLDLNVSPATPK